MNTKGHLKDIIEWDIQNWSVALKFWKNNTKLNLQSTYALEVGSKNGGLSLWAAQNGIKVLCTDLKGPTKVAIKKHKKYNVSHLIQYKALDATKIDYVEKFDLILFKSILGDIGRYNDIKMQEKAINEIYKSLRKGGELWFAENMVGSPIHGFLRKRYVQWGNTWRYLHIKEINKLLSKFSEINYMTAGFTGNFGRNSFQRYILGKIDRLILSNLIPETWRYIFIGIAIK
jgi:SAM-dependent methyltransferase